MRDTEFASSKLSIAERIQLAEDLWDSIPPKEADIALTEAQRAELDLERDPDAGEPWEAVRARLYERLSGCSARAAAPEAPKPRTLDRVRQASGPAA